MTTSNTTADQAANYVQFQATVLNSFSQIVTPAALVHTTSNPSPSFLEQLANEHNDCSAVAFAGNYQALSQFLDVVLAGVLQLRAEGKLSDSELAAYGHYFNDMFSIKGWRVLADVPCFATQLKIAYIAMTDMSKTPYQALTFAAQSIQDNQ